jgi:hypothetical protein
MPLCGSKKGKVHPVTVHETPDGKQRITSTLSLTSVLDGGGWLTPSTSSFTPGNRSSTYCTRGWVGPTTGSGWAQKISPPLQFKPYAFQPIANHQHSLHYLEYSSCCDKVKACTVPYRFRRLRLPNF